MPSHTAKCVVLKSRNHKDADKAYTCYSREFGKFSAFAKGVRKISSKRAGNLDTSNYITLSYTENTAGYKYVTEVVALKTFSKLKTDLQLTKKVYYLLELIDRLVEENEPNGKLFDLLVKTLTLLDGNGADADFVVNHFEVVLMRELGYPLDFSKCVVCGRLFSAEWKSYKLNFDLGGFICDSCPTLGVNVTRDVAIGLNSIGRGKINKSVSEYKKSSDLLKIYIKGVLEDDFKTEKLLKNV